MCLTNDPIRRPEFTPLPEGFDDLIKKTPTTSSAIAQLSAPHDVATAHSSISSSQVPLQPRSETGGGHPKHPRPLLSRTGIASSGSVPAPHSDKGQSSPADRSVAASLPDFTTKKHDRILVKHNYHDHAADTPESLTPLDEPAPMQTVTPSPRPKLPPLTAPPFVFPLQEEVMCGQYEAFEDKIPTLPVPLPASQVPKEWQEWGSHSGGDQQHETAKNNDPGQYARGGVTTPFPQKLHKMLTHFDEAGHSDVVSWQPHGRAFRVHQPQKFEAEVMPRYFRQSKLSSFQRQLNLYGYTRLTTGPDKGAYYHELFLRGKPFLCCKMRRTKIKGTGVRATSSPETEPDFYNMALIDKEGHMQGKCAMKQEMVSSPQPQKKSSVGRKLAQHRSSSPMLSGIPQLVTTSSVTNPSQLPLQAMASPPKTPNMSMSSRSLLDNKEFLPPPLSPLVTAASSLSTSHSHTLPTIEMSRGGAELNPTKPLALQDDIDHCFNSSDSDSLERFGRSYNNEDKISLKGHPFKYLAHGKLKPFEEPSVTKDVTLPASIPFLMTDQCDSASAAGTVQVLSLSTSSFSSPNNSDNDTCTGTADALMTFPTTVEDINNAARGKELLEKELFDFLSEVDNSLEANSDSREGSCGNSDTTSNGTMLDAAMAGIQCDQTLGLLLDKIVE